MSFEKNESNYVKLSSGLTAMKERTGKTILTVHIAGTGGVAESNFPTKLAITGYANNQPNLPVLLLHGVGSQGDGYVPPVMMDTNTLDVKPKKVKERLWDVAVSKPDAVIGLTSASALVGGVALGSGKEAHIERMINLLKALDEDGNLPEEIILSGHSRGAVADHEMSNRIYAEFGDRIKLHFIVTDPVPGPFHDSHIYERIIPPNTASYTVFYAPNEGRTLFNANDLNKLVFTNPLTTITAYAVPETEHISITGVRPIQYAAYLLISAIHGEERDFVESDSFNQQIQAVRHNFGEIKGEGARTKSKFDHRTPVNSDNPELANAIHKTREMFEKGYVRADHQKTSSFLCPNIETKATREGLLRETWVSETNKIKEANKGMHKKHSFFGGFSSASSISTPDYSDELKPMFPAVLLEIKIDAYQQVKAIQAEIFKDAKSGKEGDHTQFCKRSKNSGYVTETQMGILDVIRKTYEQSKQNPLSPLWKDALEKIERIEAKSEQRVVMR
ncbi:hypothetical protein BN59_02416 [Legionella massiliensis]|uniref:Uncharacterized protein n=1 Tax=Legionella massiliensis TaxID=1034943 RepID=A0A078L226_9GAMM|nr:hypothetical protein [Legionella massiliensis]CDZ78109.1 hypothetical protein BN59_02416 [Legionella massiliensis]CEE13847.1 hypothetical protein BN1094_02416 [Legionella massiliensis]